MSGATHVLEEPTIHLTSYSGDVIMQGHVLIDLLGSASIDISDVLDRDIALPRKNRYSARSSDPLRAHRSF